MAETATADRPNKVNITDVGPSRKKIEIEVPAETVSEQLGSSIDTLIAEADLPGFRRGHVPRRLIEKKFGDTVRREAKNQLVAQAFSKAVEDNKIRVIGDPTSESLTNVELTEGKPLKFEVEVEVLPTFELPNIDGISVKKPMLSVTDEMVNAEVERLKLNEGSLKEKAQPEKGDYLTGHAVMKDQDGKVVLDINDAVVQIPSADKNGKGMILGVMVEDFGQQIGLPKIGDTVTIKTTGPENHENEDVRGKKLTITFQVKTSQEILPADLDEVARRYGMETADEVRAAVRQRIDQRLQVDQQAAMRQQIAVHLLNSVAMELPERVTAQQASRNLERNRMELAYRGVDPMKIEEHLAELRASSQDVAVRELKLFFILDKAAEQMDIKVSDAEINGRIAQMAASRGERPEKMRQDIIARNQGQMVYTQVREHKTMDAILAKAKVEELSVEEFTKQMAAQSGDGAKAPAKPKAAKAEDKAEKPAAKAEKGEDKPKGKAKK